MAVLLMFAVVGFMTTSAQDITKVNPPVIQPIPNQTVSVASNVTFFCNASSDIPVTYKWSSDPYLTQCDESLPNCILGLNKPVLTLSSVPGHFSTTLTCKVTDSEGQSSTTTTILIVEGIRIISQSRALPTDPIIAIENGTVTLNCTFSYPEDIPLPVDIFWSIGGFRQTDPADNIKILISNKTAKQSTVFVDTQLVINPVMLFYTEKDPVYTFSNFYMCAAEPMGRYADVITGEVIFIKTEFTPKLNIDTQTHPKNPTRINLGNTLVVDCYFLGNPTTEIFYEEVLSNGSVKLLSPGLVQNGQVSYTINIAEVSDQLYRCVGMNTIRNEKRARVYDFRVIIQDRPQTIEIINVTKLSFFTVRVEWNIPFNNLNNISMYHVKYTERLADDIDGLSTTILSTTILSPINSTLIQNLGVNRMYDLIITSRNGVGYSDPSRIVSFASITSSDASIINVQVPRVLVTNNAFYIQWNYPSLLINPQVDENDENTNMVDVKHILITAKTNKAANDMVSMIPYSPETTSTTITGFGPDTRLTITINIIYDTPQFLEGNEIEFERQTLPENNVPEEEPEVDMDALQGENPTLRLTWSPLSVEDGADFLVNYVVTITTMELPQIPVSRKSQAEQEESDTENVTVDMQTSFESPAEPYTMYTSQVFSQLNVNGEMMRRAITSPINVASPESVPGSPPSELRSIDVSFTSITLSWNLPSTPNGVITKYTVYQTDMSGVEYSTDLTSDTFTNSTLYGGMLYRYRVTASTRVGEGPFAAINITTPIGVYSPSTPAVSQGPGNTIIGTIPKFSTLYGPLSHYQIIVVVGDSTFYSNDTTIYRYTDDKWRALGYYVTAIIPANTDNMTFTVGDGTYTQLNSPNYYNAPLSEDTQYAVVIRLHSAADDSIIEYRDSGLSVRISFPSAPFSVSTVVIPIVIVLLLLLILIIVVVILVIIFLRKRPKHTETFHLDEIKATSMKPDITTSPPRNGTSKSVSEGRVKATTPILVIQSAEVFTSVGQPTILLCEVSGSPAPEIIWSKDGCTLQGPQYRILADGSLYILDTDLKDDGSYVVSAYNDAGTVEEAVRVIVIAPLAPEPDASHPPQTVSEFIERMALLRSTMDEQLEDEYHELELEWDITVYNAKLPVNHNKNRYFNIIPYDHSRVVLNIQDNASGSDYINASFIDGYNEAHSYIATQGPIPCTFGDFWRMLWEYDIPTIVMLTNLKEDEKIKCHQYWPSCGATNYGDFQVTLKEVENIVDYGIRTFQIQPLQGGPSREIRQFHFQVWPDHGVPQCATALLGFRKIIRKYHPAGRGPVAVHCSAGVGRTGTFICIDTMMKMIEAEGKIDIFNFIREMRYQRHHHIVQTWTQYKFIHEALLETIMSMSIGAESG